MGWAAVSWRISSPADNAACRSSRGIRIEPGAWREKTPLRECAGIHPDDGKLGLGLTAPDGLVGVADLPDKDAVSEEDDVMMWASRPRAEEVRCAAFSRNDADLIDDWNRDLVAFPEDVAVRRRGVGGTDVGELTGKEG
jgi:hypothetical protein